MAICQVWRDTTTGRVSNYLQFRLIVHASGVDEFIHINMHSKNECK